MKHVKFLIFCLFFLVEETSFGQDTIAQKSNDTLVGIIDKTIQDINTINLELDTRTSLNDTIEYSDSVTTDEAKTFKKETGILSDSIINQKSKTVVEEVYPIDTTKPYGIHFIKEFEMSGGIYHYLIMDAQHQEKLLHKPNFKNKNEIYDYEDMIVKLEIKGDKMNLYSVIFSEPIIGSLERFDKFYYVSDGTKVLRVREKSGHNHFFKEFEKMYLNSDESILKGKKFKNIYSLVNFWNEYSPESVNKEIEINKYEKID